MFDLERQKENFKNHVATFTDYGNIKIIDFKAPNTSHYRIRFLFEEDYYRLHISGDLGELVATNFYNMTFEKFQRDFMNNVGYFTEKIDCHNRPLYKYDYETAKEELLERIEDNEWKESIENDYKYGSVDEFVDEVFEGYGEFSKGISESGFEALAEYDQDCWEYAFDIGKVETGILDLYMLAFRLAIKQLKQEDKQCAISAKD